MMQNFYENTDVWNQQMNHNLEVKLSEMKQLIEKQKAIQKNIMNKDQNEDQEEKQVTIDTFNIQEQEFEQNIITHPNQNLIEDDDFMNYRPQLPQSSRNQPRRQEQRHANEVNQLQCRINHLEKQVQQKDDQIINMAKYLEQTKQENSVLLQRVQILEKELQKRDAYEIRQQTLINSLYGKVSKYKNKYKDTNFQLNIALEQRNEKIERLAKVEKSYKVLHAMVEDYKQQMKQFEQIVHKKLKKESRNEYKNMKFSPILRKEIREEDQFSSPIRTGKRFYKSKSRENFIAMENPKHKHQFETEYQRITKSVTNLYE